MCKEAGLNKNIKKQRVRWLMLFTMYTARWNGISIIEFAEVLKASSLDEFDISDIKFVFWDMKERGFCCLSNWFATITPEGIDVFEGSLPTPSAIARHEVKYDL